MQWVERDKSINASRLHALNNKAPSHRFLFNFFQCTAFFCGLSKINNRISLYVAHFLSSLSAHIKLCCIQFGLRTSLNLIQFCFFAFLYTMHFFMGNAKFMDRQIKKNNYKFTPTAAVSCSYIMWIVCYPLEYLSMHVIIFIASMSINACLWSIFTSTFWSLCSHIALFLYGLQVEVRNHFWSFKDRKK